MGNLETLWEPAFITSKLLHRKIAHDDFPSGFPSGSSSQYAAVVVNQPIEDQQLLLDILAGGTTRDPFLNLETALLINLLATLTVFADGAANYVKDLKLTEPEEQNTVNWPGSST